MRLYRVTWVDDNWKRLRDGDAFHPLYVALDRQGAGRFDNPHLYAALYASTTPQGAIGESLGNSSRWVEAEVTRAKEGRPRCLVSFDVPSDLTVVDLDDPQILLDLAIRPSDVVRRNRDHTQEVAQRIWRTMPAAGTRGVQWCCYWRVEWTSVVIWSDGLAPPWFPFAEVVDVAPLAIDHSAVVLAADVLPRELG